MRILSLDAALGQASAGLVVDGVLVHERRADGARGHVELAPMAASVLQSGPPDLVAVTTGPGSFTGLRAAIALAQGIALGAGVKVVGVTVAEALADALPQLGQRALWIAIDSRRGRVFLHRDGVLASVALDAIESPAGAIAVAGDAAIEVAARLAARGIDVMLTSARLPMSRHIAAIGGLRAAGSLPPIPLLPLYVDAPEARETPQRPPPIP